MVTRNEKNLAWNHNTVGSTSLHVDSHTSENNETGNEHRRRKRDVDRPYPVEVQHLKFKEGHTKHLLQETQNKHFTRLSLECMLHAHVDCY